MPFWASMNRILMPAEDARVSVSGPSGGIWYVSLSFGFSETPDVPKALARAEIPGIDPKDLEISVCRASGPGSPVSVDFALRCGTCWICSHPA